MTPFNKDRIALTPQVLAGLEMGGRGAEIYPGRGNPRKSVLLLPELHAPSPMGVLRPIPQGIRDLQEGVFLDAERLLTTYKIRRLVLEAPNTPTLFQTKRKQVSSERDLDRLIRREKSLSEQAKKPWNPIGEELLRVALDPGLSLEERRMRVDPLIGVVGAHYLLEAVYGREPGLEICGFEEPEFHKQRGVLDGKFQTLRDQLEKGRIELEIRGVRYPLPRVKELAEAGDADARNLYNWFLNKHLIEGHVQPVVQTTIQACNRMVSSAMTAIPGDSLMIYGIYHSRDMIERLRVHSTVAFRSALPESLIAQTAFYTGPDDWFDHEALVRRSQLLVPPLSD